MQMSHISVIAEFATRMRDHPQLRKCLRSHSRGLYRWYVVMIAVPTVDERLALARRHVDAGHLIIVHQRQMVDRHKAEGRDTKAAQELLAVLERTQKVFERDLAELEKKRR